MPTYSYAIVGGGVIGVSIAAHLAERNAGKILLIERASQLGTGTTARASGGIRHQFSTEANIRCTLESMKEIKRFRELYDVDINFRQIGYLLLAENEPIAKTLEQNVKLQNQLGIPTELLTPTEVQQRFPNINTSDILCGSFCPWDGVADPNSMVEGYASAARKGGVIFMMDTDVTNISSDGTIHTSSGDIHAETVILATGPYSPKLYQKLGYAPPIHPHRKLVYQTTVPDGMNEKSPFIIGFPSGWYIKYEAGTVMMGMSQPEDSAVGDERVNMSFADGVIEAGIHRFPTLARCELLHGLAGLSDATPDHHAIMGKLPGHDHIYIATGFSGHGFQHAPMAGKIMAEWVTQGKSGSFDIAPFSPDRFGHAALPVDPLVVT